MEVTLINAPDSINTNRVFCALIFYADKLLSKRLSKSIVIKVKFVKGLRKDRKIDAQCIWEDDNYKPREFCIELDYDLGVKSTLSSLAHEMVHVKQYAKGEIRDMLRGPYDIKWLGKPFDENGTDYWDLPWEIEAYGREIGLYNRFVEHWRKLNAKDKKAQSDSANTTHTLILKKGC